MLSIPFPCFNFLHTTYRYNIVCISHIYLAHLPQPQCKLCEVRDFSFVHYSIPGSQKGQCLVVQHMC